MYLSDWSSSLVILLIKSAFRSHLHYREQVTCLNLKLHIALSRYVCILADSNDDVVKCGISD